MEDQATVWDNIAPTWAEYRQKAPKEVIDFLTGKTGKILDLGCGSGRNFVPLPDQEIYATDISSKMIEIARQTAKERKVNLVEAKVTTASEQPFNDNTFDHILCHAVIHCITTKEERQKTFREIQRILKPNGTAYVTTWSRNSQRIKNRPKETTVKWRIDKENVQERFTYIYDKEELAEEMKDAKLEIVEMKGEKDILTIVKNIR